MIPLLLGSLVFIGIGIWRLNASLDALWHQQEARILAQGQKPQRSEAWERNARNSGWFLILAGGLMLISALCIHASTASIPPRMSGVTIDGQRLTQDEWDACHHSLEECSLQTSIREHR